MKNQYFGDIRDLFKYDLIEFILNETNSSEFAFIPMLTKDIEKKDSNKRDKKRDFEKAEKDGRPGTKNPELLPFLKYYKQDGHKNERKIKEIEKYFKPKGIEVKTYKENDYFEHESRRKYFEELKDLTKQLLSSTLLFIDPDIGLERMSRPNENHLLYAEVKELHELKPYSILMIFQYLPNDRSILDYLPSGRSETLKKKLHLIYEPLYISDNEISFLFLTENDELRKRLAEILGKYIEKYKEFFSRLKVSNIDSHSMQQFI